MSLRLPKSGNGPSIAASLTRSTSLRHAVLMVEPHRFAISVRLALSGLTRRCMVETRMKRVGAHVSKAMEQSQLDLISLVKRGLSLLLQNWTFGA